ncbi:MAG TPA: T9SS type A sorting domain-containing protein [Ignavibacteria bacterium]|nr:T9SS type A sorting domain-containing protein [Ignavibacteria bacterium]HRB00122.1 T9SS type A sorting domain-containing protein [Ignavibacteria bacterium]
MTNIKIIFTLTFLVILFNNSFSQGIIIDDFSQKALPGWIWGGIDMKYSHEEDNKENGFAELFSKGEIKADSYIGKIFLQRDHTFTVGNFVNAMFKGVNNDAYVKIQLIYDVDNNSTYNEDEDLMLVTINPVSMDFDGWKEIKVKLDQDNFKIISKYKDNFEVTEDKILGIQFEFLSGKNYKDSKFESGIALISEIPNKETASDYEGSISTNKESYFSATNDPNPFKSSTTIKYNLPNATFINITVYDRLGKEVINLVNQDQSSGEHTVEFNSDDYPSGIYFYRIKTTEKTEVRKMLLAR